MVLTKSKLSPNDPTNPPKVSEVKLRNQSNNQDISVRLFTELLTDAEKAIVMDSVTGMPNPNIVLEVTEKRMGELFSRNREMFRSSRITESL